MINHETELKLQAYLDGELSEAQAKGIADLLGCDAGAQTLYQELRIAKSLLAGNELERKLPEPPEFYWSKIQRHIERLESTQWLWPCATRKAAGTFWPWKTATKSRRHWKKPVHSPFARKLPP